MLCLNIISVPDLKIVIGVWHYFLQSFLASDDGFSVTELAIPEVEQLVSWDEGEF